jgi:sugar/nucleoside kinase (ribokinase family)
MHVDSLVVHLSANRTDTLDVVGVGALNIDFLATIATGTFEGVKQVGGVEWGTEASVEESTLNDMLGVLSAEPVTASAGGSAFNALYALANMELGLKLGYVGVSGRSPMSGLTPVRDLEQLSVDVSGIAVATDALSGVCLSVTAEGERTLLTHAGANLLMPDYIESNFEALVSYLLRARIVHVTSFLDTTSALWLGRLVAEVKKRNPSVIISFDPGHVWCRDKPDGFSELIRLSNCLFLNTREFVEMAGDFPENAEERARTILEMIDSPEAQILVKKPRGISCYMLDKTGVRTDHFGHDALQPHEVKDATGAGDVFASGFLAVLAHSPLKTELGARLGMKLARHKLRFVGNFEQKDFALIRRDFIDDL